MLHGSNQQLVIENIQRRASLRRNGQATNDGRKIALVIEGGGMRSVLSGAGACALAQLGFSGLFDEVYATSAGVMNASYFLTNQHQVGMSVYFENCPTWAFLNPFRFWKILNVDYIVDRVAAAEKRLDIDLLAASPTRLLIAACDARTGEVILIDTRDTRTGIHQVLRAAMALPVFYNRTIDVDGCPCIDSGTVLPFPMHHVLQRQCTDILVLQTRPATFTEKPPTKAQQQVFNSFHARGRSHLSRAYADRREASQQVRDLALGRTMPPEGTNIAAICSDEWDVVEATTTSRKVTYEAAVRYGRKTFQVFGGSPDHFVLSCPGLSSP